MKEHIKTCYHSQCKQIDEVVIIYNLFKGARVGEKQDPVTLIVHANVQGLPKKETECWQGKKLNDKMK